MPEDKKDESEKHKEVLGLGDTEGPAVPATTKENKGYAEKIKLKRKLTYVLAVIVILAVLTGAVYFLTSGPKSQANTVVAAGDNISIYYAGSYTNGTIFSSNVGTGRPISFLVGAGQMIAGVDSGVVGMSVGESKTITVPPNEGYGYINETLHSYSVPTKYVENISRKLNNESNISVGEQFNPHNGYLFRITSFNSTNTTLDYWPLLAGYTLIFNITVASINR